MSKPTSELNSVLRRKTAIKRLLANLVAAEIAYSWAGVADPDDKPYLAEEVKEARRNFDRARCWNWIRHLYSRRTCDEWK